MNPLTSEAIEQVRGFSPRQRVFAVLESRKAGARVVFATIPKDMCDRFRRVNYPRGCVKLGHIVGGHFVPL